MLKGWNRKKKEENIENHVCVCVCVCVCIDRRKTIKSIQKSCFEICHIRTEFVHFLFLVRETLSFADLTLCFIDTHFDASTRDSFLKTLWEKEKLLVTSNFSFHTMFSTQSDNCIPICPYL